jgi:hypothetical protein
MRLKRSMAWVLMGLFLTAVIFIVGCKNFGSPEYELKIEIGDGAAGTPLAGTYVYDEFETVEYEYTSEDENVKIEVVVNGNKKVVAGELIMYTDLDVQVRIIDIRGDWTFTMKRGNDSEEEYTINFFGATAFDGTFTDDRGYTGNWTVNGDTLTMTYIDWQDYVFTGSIDQPTGNMEGTWSGDENTGEWEALRG